MAHEIRIPRLGWSMEVGTFVGWLKKDGEFIKEGDALYELEGEKASQEIESIDEGFLKVPPDAASPGSELPVGALIGYLVAEGEPLPWEQASATDAPKEPQGDRGGSTTASPSASSPSASSPSASSPSASSPSVRHRARELEVPLEEVRGSGKRGRITRDDVERFAERTSGSPQPASRSPGEVERGDPENGKRIVASPRARRIARELGVDWTRQVGTGRNGRVRETDVRAAAGTSQGTAQPVSKLRQVIASRMLESHQATAPVTLTTRVDATNLQSTRAQFKTAGGPVVPSFNDIILKLVATVLQKHPVMAGQWRGDQIVLPPTDEIHVGFAVDTEAGLFVPVVHNAGQCSLTEIARITAELTQLARAEELPLEHLQGGVFTVTNLGSFGIDAFTPVINLPECAILGVGAIRQEPVVDAEERITVGARMTLSLTFDHRIVDGAPAARFLADVRQAIENPVPKLL